MPVFDGDVTWAHRTRPSPSHGGDFGLGAVSYSHSDQLQNGTLALTADDSTGSDAGWNVTVQSSACSHVSGGTIPADNFVAVSPDTAT